MDRMSRKVSCLSKIDICRNLPRKLLEKLAEMAVEKEFSKGQLIFGPYETEERIYVVREGKVETYQLSADGKKVIIDILGPGNILGNTAFASHPLLRVATFAEARENSLLCAFSKSDFSDVLKTVPQIALNVLEHISTKLHEADNRINDLALSDAATKLVNEMLRFGKRFGTVEDGKIILTTRITHQELAQMTGLTRETVTRSMNKLRKGGVIDFDASKHIIINEDKSKEYRLSA